MIEKTMTADEALDALSDRYDALDARAKAVPVERLPRTTYIDAWKQYMSGRQAAVLHTRPEDVARCLERATAALDVLESILRVAETRRGPGYCVNTLAAVLADKRKRKT